jgi:hypothetical protein
MNRALVGRGVLTAPERGGLRTRQLLPWERRHLCRRVVFCPNPPARCRRSQGFHVSSRTPNPKAKIQNPKSKIEKISSRERGSLAILRGGSRIKNRAR